MSKFKTEFNLKENKEKILATLLCIIQDLDWILVGHTESKVTCKEYNPKPLLKKPTHDATIEISINEIDKLILIKGKNIGLGPIQSKHVKNQVLLIKDMLKKKIHDKLSSSLNISNINSSKQDIENKVSTLSSELKNITDLYGKGILTKEEFNKAKERLLNKN